MIKVRIYNEETDKFFDTSMPKIPQKGELIGCWFDDEWNIGSVNSVLYEFDKENNFLFIEINASF